MQEPLSFLVEVAADAGAIMMQHWQQKVPRFRKADRTIVTEVDLEISRMVARRVREEWPDAGLFSEETRQESSQISGRHGFIIDELDGTQAYADQRGGFTFQGAYYNREREVPVAVIFDPLNQVLVYAIRGEGVYAEREGKRNRITPRYPVAWEGIRFAHHRHYMTPTYQRLYQQLKVSPERIVATGGIGSKVLDFALGRVDALVSFSRHIQPWDWAPGRLILEELGFSVSHLDGSPLALAPCKPGDPLGYLVCPLVYALRMQTELRALTPHLARYQALRPDSVTMY